MAGLLFQCSMVVIVEWCVEFHVCDSAMLCFTFLSSLNEMTSNLDQCTMQGRKRSLFHSDWVGRLNRHDEFHPCLANGWCWFPTPVACLAYLSPMKETTSNPGWCAMSVTMMETWPSFVAVTSQSKHVWEASDDDYDHMNEGLVATSHEKLQIITHHVGCKQALHCEHNLVITFHHSSPDWCDSSSRLFTV